MMESKLPKNCHLPIVSEIFEHETKCIEHFGWQYIHRTHEYSKFYLQLVYFAEQLMCRIEIWTIESENAIEV